MELWKLGRLVVRDGKGHDLPVVIESTLLHGNDGKADTAGDQQSEMTDAPWMRVSSLVTIGEKAHVPSLKAAAQQS